MKIVTGGLLMLSGACLALGIIQIRFWLAERIRRDNLAFAVVCLSAVVFCLFERSIMLSATPDEALFYIRWSQLPGSLLLISIAWFAYLKLQGRRWLFWTFAASRVLVCAINFIIPNGINYREITAIKNVSILGETVSSPAVVPNPWMSLVQVSHLLLIIFCLDASLLAWRRGKHNNASIAGIAFSVVGGIILLFSIGVLWGFLPVPIFISFLVLFIVGVMVEELNINRLKAAIFSEKLTELVRSLMNAQEKERARVADELQEDLSQNLALLSIGLKELRHKPFDPARIDDHIDHLDAKIENLTLALNRISHELHPATLRLLGLEVTLRGLCREFAVENQVDIEFAAENCTCKLPNDVSLCLYRITQDWLQNVVGHNGASKASVNIKLEKNKIRLTITDDGKDFDLKAAKETESFGLICINERIRGVEGMVKIKSIHEGGTKIEAIVPVSQEIN